MESPTCLQYWGNCIYYRAATKNEGMFSVGAYRDYVGWTPSDRMAYARINLYGLLDFPKVIPAIYHYIVIPDAVLALYICRP